MFGYKPIKFRFTLIIIMLIFTKQLCRKFNYFIRFNQGNLKNIMQEFKKDLKQAKSMQALKKSLQKLSTQSIKNKQLFYKFIISSVNRGKLQYDLVLHLRANQLLQEYPHLLIQALAIQTEIVQTKQQKQMKFKQAYAQLTRINDKSHFLYLQSMLDHKIGNYFHSINPEQALKCYNRSLTGYDKLFEESQKKLQDLVNQKQNEDDKFLMKKNALNAILRGIIETIAEISSICFDIQHKKKNYKESEEYLKRGLRNYVLFKTITKYSPFYHNLKRLDIELRWKYKKQNEKQIEAQFKELAENLLDCFKLKENIPQLYKFTVCLLITNKYLYMLGTYRNTSLEDIFMKTESSIYENVGQPKIIEKLKKAIKTIKQELLELKIKNKTDER